MHCTRAWYCTVAKVRAGFRSVTKSYERVSFISPVVQKTRFERAQNAQSGGWNSFCNWWFQFFLNDSGATVLAETREIELEPNLDITSHRNGMKRQDDISMIDRINENRSDNSGGDSGASNDPFISQPKNPEWDSLLIVCQKGDASAARRILRENPSSKSHANVMGQSALHIAAWWNHVECVEVLLQSGADVQAVNSFSGATPIHECLQSNQIHRSKEQRRRRIDCISLLLQAKADPTALDGLGRLPLECFVIADERDAADYEEIEELIEASERVAKNPVQNLLRKLNSKEITLDKVDQFWLEKVVPDLDIPSTYTLLSSELLSMTEAWIDRSETSSQICNESTSQSDAIDNHYYLACVTWLWSKVVEISPGVAMQYEGDDETIPGHIDSLLQSTLCRLLTAHFNRYENLHKKKKGSLDESSSLLRDDLILSSWTKLCILLVRERDNVTSADRSDPSKIWKDFENIKQTWMTIARRDYFELAQLWWDRFEISPIGVVNRQGMTALQFAARSGHFRMVNWLIGHPSLSNNRAELLLWIESQDHGGRTALAAAKTNQHEQIVKLLEGFAD